MRLERISGGRWKIEFNLCLWRSNYFGLKQDLSLLKFVLYHVHCTGSWPRGLLSTLQGLATCANWAAKQQTWWVLAPWWFCVSPWWICITFVWPSGSQKLPAPSSQSECHLHFVSIRLCLALLLIISIISVLFFVLKNTNALDST